jgi:predicted DNA-binding protein (MmcQ/YjbR family)
MNAEYLREYCLSFAGAEESMPFGDDTLVIKVMNKMFALINLEGELSINLKCDPQLAIELREEYNCVLPGYHMNKTHWNTIIIDGSIQDLKLREWIELSYRLIVNSLSKKLKDELDKIQKNGA